MCSAKTQISLHTHTLWSKSSLSCVLGNPISGPCLCSLINVRWVHWSFYWFCFSSNMNFILLLMEVFFSLRFQRLWRLLFYISFRQYTFCRLSQLVLQNLFSFCLLMLQILWLFLHSSILRFPSTLLESFAKLSLALHVCLSPPHSHLLISQSICQSDLAVNSYGLIVCELRTTPS